MKKLNIILILIFFVGVFTRLPLVEKMHSHTDSSSLTLALIDYNFTQETPAPPGYPLYFAFGKLINQFVYDPHLSLLLISVLFSGIGAVVFYLTGRTFGGKTVGIISSLLFLSAPTFYFFGLTVYPYLMVIAVLTLFIRSIYQIGFTKKNTGWVLGLIYAILLGIRPQELITTLPLFLLGLYWLSPPERYKSLIVFILTTFSWLLPFLNFVGGITNYLRISSNAASKAIPWPAISHILSKKFELTSGLYLTLGIGLPIMAYFLFTLFIKAIGNKKYLKTKRKHILYFSVWVIPVLLFNLFIRTEHAGYQAGYLIFSLFVIAYAIPKILKENKFLISIVVLFIIFVNSFIFFYNRDPGYLKPYRQSSFHYSDIRRNDYALENKINYIKKTFHPSKTIIIAGPYFWRNARYYLPNYQIFEIDAIFTQSGNNNSVIREAKFLHYREYISATKSLKINSPVSNIVLFDDESDGWIEKGVKIKKFNGSTKVTIIPVEKGDVLKYSLNKIVIVHGN